MFSIIKGILVSIIGKQFANKTAFNLLGKLNGFAIGCGIIAAIYFRTVETEAAFCIKHADMALLALLIVAVLELVRRIRRGGD